jgi:DNA-binding transcriptional LysR family regulator
MSLPTWTPDLATLDLLLSVAECGSVGQAAAVHGISQPSASSRLARLERQVGAALLVRHARGSRLTPAGEAVAAWARPVVEAARELTDNVTTLRGDRQARLRVASSLTIAEYLVPGWLVAFRSRHPGLDLVVTVANSAGVTAAVREGTVDVGFIETPDPPADLSRQRIGRDRLALVVAASYPLAARPTRVTVRDLLEQPLLLREPGSGTRETFVAALGHPSLPYATELGSTAIIVATALTGGGIGVVSARAVAAEVAAGRLVELTPAGLTLDRPLHAIWLGRAPAELAGELIAVAAAG